MPNVSRHMNLLRASCLVGGIGTVLSVPLVLTLALYTNGRPHPWFFLVSPGVIFAVASAIFAVAYSFLPLLFRRATYAGVIAGVVTLLAYEALYAGVLNLRSLSIGSFGLFPYLVSLIVLGWIPILGGIYAGTKAARFLDGASS